MEFATGLPAKKLKICGRPLEGSSEVCVVLEELDPDKPVQMHWTGKIFMPHFRNDCPYCDGSEELKAMWYAGALSSGHEAIVELTETCFDSLMAYARRVKRKCVPATEKDLALLRELRDRLRQGDDADEVQAKITALREKLESGADGATPISLADAPLEAIRYRGLRVKISRANFRFSPRVLRCEARVEQLPDWHYDTRRELARIWGIPLRPRLYREEGA